MCTCARGVWGGERERGRRTDRWGTEIEVCSSAVKENKFWCQIEEPAVRHALRGGGMGGRAERRNSPLGCSDIYIREARKERG